MIEETTNTQTPEETTTHTGRLIVVLEGRENIFSLDELGLNMDMTEDEILASVRDLILEGHGIDVTENRMYAVQKITGSGNVYVLPKSPQGV